MRVKNWMIVTAGFIVGILYALSGIVYAYIKAPSMPGPNELGIQAMIVKVTKPDKALVRAGVQERHAAKLRR